MFMVQVYCGAYGNQVVAVKVLLNIKNKEYLSNEAMVHAACQGSDYVVKVCACGSSAMLCGP